MLRIFFSLIAFHLAAVYSYPLDIEYPDQFYIQQDNHQRLFHIKDDQRPCGVVISSDYAVLDFYDTKGNKHCTNLHDDLFDSDGNLIGTVKVASDYEWFSNTTRIEIFDEEGTPLTTFESEDNSNTFIFRSVENNKAVAIAILGWQLTGEHYYYFFDHYVRKWSVMLLPEMHLQTKKISPIFLVWALMKHTQKLLPSSYDLEYVSTPPAPYEPDNSEDNK